MRASSASSGGLRASVCASKRALAREVDFGDGAEVEALLRDRERRALRVGDARERRELRRERGLAQRGSDDVGGERALRGLELVARVIDVGTESFERAARAAEHVERIADVDADVVQRERARVGRLREAQRRRIDALALDAGAQVGAGPQRRARGGLARLLRGDEPRARLRERRARRQRVTQQRVEPRRREQRPPVGADVGGGGEALRRACRGDRRRRGAGHVRRARRGLGLVEIGADGARREARAGDDDGLAQRGAHQSSVRR